MLHLLLIPRSLEISQRHPFDALRGDVLRDVRTKVAQLAPFLNTECARLFGPLTSHNTTGSTTTMTTTEKEKGRGEEREWMAFLKIGVHASPSMNHLHIHIMTPDLSSECLKTKAHYNSFSTPFFVPLERFPLAPDDPCRDPAQREAWKKGDMTCWHCGQVVGNVPVLKRHLAECWQRWRRQHTSTAADG